MPTVFYLIERPRKSKSKKRLDLRRGVVVYSIAVRAPVQRRVNGDGNSTGVGSTPSVGLQVHDTLAVHHRRIIVAWDDLKLVVGTGLQLRLQCCGVSAFKDEIQELDCCAESICFARPKYD